MFLYKEFWFKILKNIFIYIYMCVAEMISEKFLYLVRGKELRMQREMWEYGVVGERRRTLAAGDASWEPLSKRARQGRTS